MHLKFLNLKGCKPHCYVFSMEINSAQLPALCGHWYLKLDYSLFWRETETLQAYDSHEPPVLQTVMEGSNYHWG